MRQDIPGPEIAAAVEAWWRQAFVALSVKEPDPEVKETQLLRSIEHR
jgi:hypothetical protein